MGAQPAARRWPWPSGSSWRIDRSDWDAAATYCGTGDGRRRGRAPGGLHRRGPGVRGGGTDWTSTVATSPPPESTWPERPVLRPLLTHAIPYSAVQALLHIGHAYVELSDPAGARVVLRERCATSCASDRNSVASPRKPRSCSRCSTRSAPRTWVRPRSTTAELRLLPLLTTYLSMPEIAERLHVSRNTVKTQAISIYREARAFPRGARRTIGSPRPACSARQAQPLTRRRGNAWGMIRGRHSSRSGDDGALASS